MLFYKIIITRKKILYKQNTQTPKQILGDHMNIRSDQGIEPENYITEVAYGIAAPPRQSRYK